MGIELNLLVLQSVQACQGSWFWQRSCEKQKSAGGASVGYQTTTQSSWPATHKDHLAAAEFMRARYGYKTGSAATSTTTNSASTKRMQRRGAEQSLPFVNQDGDSSYFGTVDIGTPLVPQFFLLGRRKAVGFIVATCGHFLVFGAGWHTGCLPSTSALVLLGGLGSCSLCVAGAGLRFLAPQLNYLPLLLPKLDDL
ncbi:hypothetical protein B0H12DRAFT_622971 [Mycena haematopus]|nr:hypothetical protein B0H12DRAFT_622971 [Mycena haematopus]